MSSARRCISAGRKLRPGISAAPARISQEWTRRERSGRGTSVSARRAVLHIGRSGGGGRRRGSVVPDHRDEDPDLPDARAQRLDALRLLRIPEGLVALDPDDLPVRLNLAEGQELRVRGRLEGADPAVGEDLALALHLSVRVGIAETAPQRAEVVLADEPIASLDPSSAKRVMQTPGALNAAEGITAMVSLHRVEYARRYCPRTIAMGAGRIVFDGPSRELALPFLREISGEAIGEPVLPHAADGDVMTRRAPRPESSPREVRAHEDAHEDRRDRHRRRPRGRRGRARCPRGGAPHHQLGPARRREPGHPHETLGPLLEATRVAEAPITVAAIADLGQVRELPEIQVAGRGW